MQLVALSLCFLAALMSSQAVDNEEFLILSEMEQYKVVPRKLRGAFTAKEPAEDECSKCTEQARVYLDRFTQFIYYNFYEQNMTISNPYELGAIKTCEEIDESMACYKECYERNEVPISKRPIEYLSVRKVKIKYCEDPPTSSHPTCRLAVTHGCDMKYRQRECGNQLEGYKKCMEEELYYTGQDCSGVCTPARRYHKLVTFIWDLHCNLKTAMSSSCEIIVSYFCFDQVKDTDTNFGIYAEMESIPELNNNMTHACSVLQSPYPCIETATNGFYDYYGYNTTYACKSIEDKVEMLKDLWNSMISPFCGEEAVEGAATIEEACPPPAATVSPPPRDPRKTRPPIRTTTTETPQWKVYRPKPGKCPAAEKIDGSCEKKCGDDSHCAGRQKCCEQCCVQPIIRRSRLGRGYRGSSSSAPVISRTLHLLMISLLLAVVSVLF